MSESQDIKFKVAMLGPSRVGKTSLLSAVIENGKEALVGSGVTITPMDNTKEILLRNVEEIRGNLAGGEFSPRSLQGTQDPRKYAISLSAGRSQLPFSILDYPGEWLAKGPDEWRECEEWCCNSSTLLVPIDSVVTMEADLPERRVAANRIQCIQQVADVARLWAQQRVSEGSAGLLVLAPVKCESYFNDNGGHRDMADHLYRKTREMYGPVLQAVRQGDPARRHTRIEYHPVDTVGAVDLTRVTWSKNSKGVLDSFDARFRVRSTRYSPRGAEGVLASMCKLMIEHRKAEQEAEANAARRTADSARWEAERPRNVFSSFWRSLSGASERDRKIAGELSADAQRKHSDLSAIGAAVEKLGQRAAGPRVRPLEGAV